MKINCERKLGDVERENLEVHARLMIRLGLSKDWVGDGVLYQHAGYTDSFQFVDQKYQ
jgi:hypothetical protein